MTPEQILELHYPSVRSGPEAGTFEIAIMMAGAVSAGAYTAGAMDLLIEALDLWEAEKAKDVAAGRAGTAGQTVPHHKVILRLIAGTSAGGMNGAVAAAALSSTFPHIYDSRKFAKLAPAAQTQRYAGNPFYNAWVVSIDIMDLLKTDDLGKTIPASLLNCASLAAISDRIVAFKGDGYRERAWLADPYEVRLTVTNLRGVPFAYTLGGGGGSHEGMLMHADHMAFAVTADANNPRVRPDCIVLDPKADRSGKAWCDLSLSGLATGAFPAFLASRDLERNTAQYDWRFSMFDIDTKRAVFTHPQWPQPRDNRYRFVTVDGGVMNNEPFEIARSALAGPRGNNPQSGEKADRAVIVIDPFVEDPDQGPIENADIAGALKATVSSWKNQARLSMQDLVQIQREDVYSRFMIAPSRNARPDPAKPGQKQIVEGAGALATSELGAFIGFFNEKYRQHDFLLGRRNAQKFLRDSFAVPEENSILAHWSGSNKTTFVSHDEAGRPDGFQIIPLCGHLAAIEEPTPVWPRGVYAGTHDAIADAVGARAKAVLKVALPAAIAAMSSFTKSKEEKRKKHGLFLRIGAYAGELLGGIAGKIAASTLSSRLQKIAVAQMDDAFKAVDERPFD